MIILIIESGYEDKSISKLLAKEKIPAYQAHTGKEALEILSKNKVDLIILNSTALSFMSDKSIDSIIESYKQIPTCIYEDTKHTFKSEKHIAFFKNKMIKTPIESRTRLTELINRIMIN